MESASGSVGCATAVPGVWLLRRRCFESSCAVIVGVIYSMLTSYAFVNANVVLLLRVLDMCCCCAWSSHPECNNCIAFVLLALYYWRCMLLGCTSFHQTADVFVSGVLLHVDATVVLRCFIR